MSAAAGARQYHYLSSESHVHPFLVALWDEVREASGGRLDVTVHSANEGLTRTHLGIVQQLIEGEIEFYVSMGGVLATLVPAMAVHDLPFVFSTPAHAQAVFDGPLGDHLCEALEPHGIVALPFGLMENGFRHITAAQKPVSTAEDLAGLRIRVPAAPMVEDAFRALGAEPVEVYVADCHRALADGRIDALEGPLSVAAALDLHGVAPCVSLTAHMWSGFYLLAGRRFWKGLAPDLREGVLASVKRHVALQRAHTETLNRELEARLAGLGVAIAQPAQQGFRDRLSESGFYARWESRIGRRAWALLEESVGPIG